MTGAGKAAESAYGDVVNTGTPVSVQRAAGEDPRCIVDDGCSGADTCAVGDYIDATVVEYSYKAEKSSVD